MTSWRSVKPTVTDTSPADTDLLFSVAERKRTPAAPALLTLSWTLSICLVLLRSHPGNTQPLPPRGREGILPACQHVLLGTSGDVKATGQDLLLRASSGRLNHVYTRLQFIQIKNSLEKFTVFQFCIVLQAKCLLMLLLSDHREEFSLKNKLPDSWGAKKM